MAIQMVSKGRTIYHSNFRICQTRASDPNTERQKRRRIFHFSGEYTFQGTYRAGKNGTIEGNIWQAGADSDAILLGVSFVAHQQVLLNTIHVVKPGKSTQSRLDQDLFMRTDPLKPIAH